MTRATARQEGNEFSLSCEGHAGDAESCNYITGVMYAFAGYVKALGDAGEAIVREITINEREPRFTVRVCGDGRAEAAFDAAVIGLKQLEAVRAAAIFVQNGENKKI